MRRRDHERIVHGLERQISYLQRQNQELLDKLMHVTGNTWTLPPREYNAEADVELPDSFFTSPEQYVDAAAEE